MAYAVLVEIPLAEVPATALRGVRLALEDAVTNFERGGRQGWQGCVAAVRTALETWNTIRQPVSLGPSPSTDQLVDNIRIALRKFANEAHFGPLDAPDQPDPGFQARLTSFLDQYFRASRGWQRLDDEILVKLRQAKGRLASKTASDTTRVTLRRADLTRLTFALDLMRSLAGYRKEGYET